MYKKVSLTEFKQEFKNKGVDDFSNEGLNALFKYLSKYNLELDAISFSLEYKEVNINNKGNCDIIAKLSDDMVLIDLNQEVLK